MEVTERIKQHLATEPVVLFMKGTPDFPQCGFSAQAVAALKQVGATFHAVNIFEDLELRDELKRFSNWPTCSRNFRTVEADAFFGTSSRRGSSAAFGRGGRASVRPAVSAARASEAFDFSR